MALASLKPEAGESGPDYAYNLFGYGTEISLNGDQCEALGITKMLRAGQSVTIRARGVVTRSTESLEMDADSIGADVSLCIQLTDMEVRAEGGANAAKAAQMLYGSND